MGIEVNIDFVRIWQSLQALGSQNPAAIVLQLFLSGGWVVFLLFLTYGLYVVWLRGRQIQFYKKWQWTLLSIDVPKNNEQTPKAVESIFNALAGAHSSANLWDKYYKGKVQEFFSFEIVSFEGFIQFLIKTPTHFRDLVEAAIYAQYPDAEISEVEDYAPDFADIKFPHKKYNLWGTEFVLIKDYPYPIRTYPEFEHTLTQQFIDPMADLLEIMSRFSQDEYVWLQLVVTPLGAGWGEKAKKVMKEMKGEIYVAPVGALTTIILKPVEWITFFADVLVSFFSPPGTSTTADKKDEFAPLRLLNMSPGERGVMEKVENKLAKRGFRANFRFIYLGDKSNFNKARGVSSLVGAVNQFSTADANGFKPGNKSKTQVNYFNVKKRLAYRQNRLLMHILEHSNYNDELSNEMILNTEELASLWHFPVMTVKAPTLEVSASKKSMAPSRLPVSSELRAREGWVNKNNEMDVEVADSEQLEGEDDDQSTGSSKSGKSGSGSQPTPPHNLPTV